MVLRQRKIGPSNPGSDSKAMGRSFQQLRFGDATKRASDGHPLAGREAFAKSIRKEKKALIMKERRSRLFDPTAVMRTSEAGSVSGSRLNFE